MPADYEWRDGMPEVTGIGGEYERVTRRMVKAGMVWWDGHPGANPRFSAGGPVFNAVWAENDDARALEAAVTRGAGPGGCSGAMVNMAIRSCLAIRAQGWEAYLAALREAESRSL